jgi:hypothetical protein
MSGGDPSEYTHGMDATTLHDGAPSIRFAAAVPQPRGYGTLMQSRLAGPYVGKRVKVSAFVKGEGIAARGDLWVRVQASDSPGDGPGLGGGVCRLSDTFDWKPCEVSFDVASRADRLEIGIGLAGRGTIWLEGLKVEEAGAAARSTAPEGWSLDGSDVNDYAIALDTTAKHGGKSSGNLRALVPDPHGFGALAQEIGASSFAGKRVRLSAAIRTAGVTRWAGLWMRVDRPRLRRGAFDNMMDRPIKGTTDWARYEVVLDVAPDAADIALGILLEGGGQAWIDDVSLEVVGPSVLTTDRPTNATPKNLDFETPPPPHATEPPGWIRGDNWTEYAAASDGTVKHGGTSSGSLRSVVAAPKGVGALLQTIAATGYLGKRVRLSGFLKTDQVTGWSGLLMRVDDDEQMSAFDNMSDRPVKGTTDWARYDVVLDVSPAAKDIALGSLLGGAGQIWIDDLTLTVVDRKVPTTGSGPSAPVTGPPSRATDLGAENLDFEK